tara:strand:+ start:2187 stop:2759 length:573 start_codon:yes stop_codon:yes gene_type:complete
MHDIFDYLKSNITVIGLSGTAGSGKDYVAKEYFVKKYGFHNISLAWHFKIQCISHGDATYDEVFDTKPPRVRRLLQVLGTEQGREVWGENIWVNTMFAWMTLYHKDWGIDKFVIPDVRFPNELTAVQMLNGNVYRVVGDRQGELTEEAWNHVSEQSLTDDMDIYNGFIDNNQGSNLEEQISSILQETSYA